MLYADSPCTARASHVAFGLKTSLPRKKGSDMQGGDRLEDWDEQMDWLLRDVAQHGFQEPRQQTYQRLGLHGHVRFRFTYAPLHKPLILAPHMASRSSNQQPIL